MERYKKRDMLQSVSALIKANDSILRMIVSNMDVASQALVQCQEAAIMLGTYIETLGEKYADLVILLEDYCENIYLMSENFADEKLCRKLTKKIQRQLMRLENSIKYEMPDDRKEIVFLPYMASMWDSLESIWRAADQDDNVDVYVIPIPYYDKNPDGSLRDEHYEGNLYPDYVTVTRYDEYDFEGRRPDVIFIHAPYDECNHVTSVHPYFYAKNIRNYTDMLVYIPYFILKEIEPDDQGAIDTMKHFCFIPGVIYADKVIVQSEKMRRIYINEYIKAAKEMGLSGEHTNRSFLEQKILGIGSPKVDKVLMTRKENLVVPDEWLKLIEKPDGSLKKIIFYNTSISALLHNDERMLIKMESVFKSFKEKKADFTLLWRPHPLIENTLTSMRPELWDKYKVVRDKYISDGWGIYDNTSDMDRAVALSDAYYGDPSSIVQLYEKTGKLTMIQKPELNEKYEKILLSSRDWYVDGEQAWFVDSEQSILFCVNLHTRVCEFQEEIPSENSKRYGLNPRCVGFGDDIFCMPSMGTHIWVFQKKIRKFLKIGIDNFDRCSPIGVYWSFVYNDKIYAVSYGIGRIIEINPVTKEVDSYYPIEMDVTAPYVCMAENIIYSLASELNKIICFDVLKKETFIYNIPDIDKKIREICVDGKKIWMCGYYKEIYLWNKEDDSINIINDFPARFGVYNSGKDKEDILDCESYEYESPAFAVLVAVDEYIWCIPYMTNKILYINRNTYKIEALDIEGEVETEKSILSRRFTNGKYYLVYIRENRYIGLFSTKNNHIVEIDARERKTEVYEYSYSDLCQERVKRVFLKDKDIMYENAVINLENYFDGTLEVNAENGVNGFNNIGLNIYQEIICL